MIIILRPGSLLSWRLTDSDPFQLASLPLPPQGHGQRPGLYNTLLWLRASSLLFSFYQFPLDTLRRHTRILLRRTMDPGGVTISLLFIFVIRFQDVQGRPVHYRQQHTRKGGKSYRSRGVSYFLNQRYPAFGGSKPRAIGGADVQERDVGKGICYFVMRSCYHGIKVIKMMSTLKTAKSGYLLLDGRIDYGYTSR